MTNRWVQPVASVVAMVMIANLQYAWTSSLGSGPQFRVFCQQR